MQCAPSQETTSKYGSSRKRKKYYDKSLESLELPDVTIQKSKYYVKIWSIVQFDASKVSYLCYTTYSALKIGFDFFWIALF